MASTCCGGPQRQAEVKPLPNLDVKLKNQALEALISKGERVARHIQGFGFVKNHYVIEEGCCVPNCVVFVVSKEPLKPSAPILKPVEPYEEALGHMKDVLKEFRAIESIENCAWAAVKFREGRIAKISGVGDIKAQYILDRPTQCVIFIAEEKETLQQEKGVCSCWDVFAKWRRA